MAMMAGMVGASPPAGDICLNRRPSKSHPLSSSTLRIMRTSFRPISLRITPTKLPVAMASRSSRRLKPVVCLANKGGGGGEGEWFENQNQSQGSPWKFLENAFGRFKKELTVQDMLRARKERKPEELDYGGGEGLPPQGGGGGGGGGQGDQDPWDDFFQTTMATIGFISVYFYILNGEFLTKLARDYIIYLFGGKKSIRLAESMESWKDFVEETSVKKVTHDPQGLSQVILRTPTWWYNPLDDEDEEDDEEDKNDRSDTEYDSE